MIILNGSIRGAQGTTARMLKRIEGDHVTLADYAGTVDALRERIRAAKQIVIGTGTYWSSWGSPLQRFIEVMTSDEATEVFMGKPLGVVVTMDSVGGAD